MAVESLTRKDLDRLSDGYQRLAGHCRARLLFGVRGNDVISQQAHVADQTAGLLRQHSLHLIQNGGLPPDVIDLRPHGSYVRLMFAEASMDIIVSPHPSRQPSVPEILRAASPSAKPRFEGILPFLLRYRMELDGGSGRTLLHLAIAEIPYSNLLSRNTFWDPDDPQSPEEVGQHAISLAVLPVTSDGRILLSRRASAAGSYAGMIGPYVTGTRNCEIVEGLPLTVTSSGSLTS